MNLQFRTRGLNVNASLRGLLEEGLHELEALTTITSAEVVLEHQRSASPAFQAVVHLAVPGPDIHAAARDHTLEAAWLKVLERLRRQLEERKRRHEARLKLYRHHWDQERRAAGAVAGARR